MASHDKTSVLGFHLDILRASTTSCTMANTRVPSNELYLARISPSLFADAADADCRQAGSGHGGFAAVGSACGTIPTGYVGGKLQF